MRKLLIGLGAGLAAGFVMNQFTRTVSGLSRGREGRGAAPGSERLGRGAQPPQAKTDASKDATVRVGTAAYEALTGERPAKQDEVKLGSAAHYAFSASLGAAYALLYDEQRWVRAGRGALFGAAVWAIADEGVIPAMGLSRGPRHLGLGVLLFSLAAHLAYGLSLDAAHRALKA
jgi:hypothetical protein